MERHAWSVTLQAWPALFSRMAAVTGHLDFRNWTGDSILRHVWVGAGNSKTVSLIVTISVLILSPIIVSGNSLVFLSTWKDLLKKLWSSWPSHYIILSMAVADFMVAFVTSILTAYWCWAVYQKKNPVFGPVRFSFTFLNLKTYVFEIRNTTEVST